jgi:hypothetical protein
MGMINKRKIFTFPYFGVGRQDTSSFFISYSLHKKKILRPYHSVKDLRRENSHCISMAIWGLQHNIYLVFLHIPFIYEIYCWVHAILR